MQKTYRQGDVLVQLVGQLPSELKDVPRDNGRIVLAYGEVTGHAHAITNRIARFYENTTGDRFLKLDKPAALTHEEHGTINLPAGNYRVIRQREYSPEAIRNVAD